MRPGLQTFATLAALAVCGRAATGQMTKPTPLAAGTEAPKFTLPAATKDGVSPSAASLTDFRGQTVVLAFFYKARTGG